MGKYSLISVDTIISKLFREGIIDPSYNESDIIEMIGDALSAIKAYKQYEQKVDFLQVTNHQVLIPDGLQEIIMIAYTLDTSVNTSSCTEECNINDDCDTDCESTEDSACWSCHNKYYIPDQRYYDLIKDYNNIFSSFSNYFYKNYLPLKLASSPFSITNMLHCSNCINVTANSEHEYSIQNGMIRTSFQEGNLCIAYTRTPLDEEGYPMIPDLYEYQEAIVSYILMKRAKAEYLADPSAPNRIKWREFESDWHWYIRSAKNEQLMPSNIDERENLYRGNKKLIKDYNGYYNFFGNLNNLERFNLNGSTRRTRFN